VSGDWFYGIRIEVLAPVTVLLIGGAAEFGNWVGLRFHAAREENADASTLAGATLGLLALLVAFSFSMAEERYLLRSEMVFEEANAISSTANFALMLPQPLQKPILGMLRDYTAIRISLGVPEDSEKMERDVARSVALQTSLWQQATAVMTENQQSLAVYQFVKSLNEMNNIHETRLTYLRNHVPSAVIIMLIGTAMVAMGFTGYNAGVIGGRRHLSAYIMTLTMALLIMLVVDLDRPDRGVVNVPVQALVDTLGSIPP
jgi:hypothetical protein